MRAMSSNSRLLKMSDSTSTGNTQMSECRHSANSSTTGEDFCWQDDWLIEKAMALRDVGNTMNDPSLSLFELSDRKINKKFLPCICRLLGVRPPESLNSHAQPSSVIPVQEVVAKSLKALNHEEHEGHEGKKSFLYAFAMEWFAAPKRLRWAKLVLHQKLKR